MRFFRFKKLVSLETGKYLRYAVGEVVLVVIGILIALQVNNFNEAKKYKKEQKEFLIGLKDELILDTIKISEQERIFKGFQESVLNGKDLLSKTSHSNEEKKIFVNAIHDLLKLTPINKNVNRHDIKISEGIISNIEIKNLLIKYFEVTKYNQEAQTKFGVSLQNIFIENIMPYIKLYPESTASDNYDLKKLKRDYRIRNSFEMSILYRNVAFEQLNAQRNMAIELLNKISLEL